MHDLFNKAAKTHNTLILILTTHLRGIEHFITTKAGTLVLHFRFQGLVQDVVEGLAHSKITIYLFM